MIEFFVVYRRPTDYPDAAFVVRVHVIEGRGKRRRLYATDKVWIGDTLADVHRFIPPDKTRMPRHEDDEPQIVEWWF